MRRRGTCLGRTLALGEEAMDAEKRAEEAGTPDHRQMTAADLDLPAIDNAATLERKKA